MLLATLQETLASLYDTRLEYPIAEFLFSDPALLPPPLRHTTTDEQVLICEDTRQIGVYLSKAVLERLAQASPLARLTQENLEDFWTALEGVSHFQYLAWASAHERGLSLRQLEVQAEIDKYVLSRQLLARQTRRVPRELHTVLFERWRFATHLSAAERMLYWGANREAAIFCREVERHFTPRGELRASGLQLLRRSIRVNERDRTRQVRRLRPR